MVLLEITAGELDPFYGHVVLCGEAVVGLVTSGAYGHRTGKKLALAYLLAERDELVGARSYRSDPRSDLSCPDTPSCTV